MAPALTNSTVAVLHAVSMPTKVTGVNFTPGAEVFPYVKVVLTPSGSHGATVAYPTAGRNGRSTTRASMA